MIIQTVRVINKNNTGGIKDRCGGVDYTFPAGEVTVIPLEAAQHIFGYGMDEKEREAKFRRSGLNLHPKGREIWSKFIIKETASGADGLHQSNPSVAA